MSGRTRGDAAPGKGGATTASIATNDSPHGTRPVRQDDVEAARHLADRAKRLSLRAAGHGQVSVDDLLDVVAATGALVDVMLGGPPVVPAPGLDPLDAVRAAGIPVPDPVPDDEDAGGW